MTAKITVTMNFITPRVTKKKRERIRMENMKRKTGTKKMMTSKKWM